MTQIPDQVTSSSSFDKPLGMSSRMAGICLAASLLLAAGLLTKQISCARIATRDATGFYLPLAEAIAAGDDSRSQIPMIPPLYPVAVAYTYKSLSPVGCSLELSARLVSSVSLLLLVVCVFFVTRELGGPRPAIVAAALTASNPWLVRFGAATAPAVMYATLVALVVLLLLYYWRRPSVMLAIAVGSAAALAALTRPEGIYVPFMAAVTIIAISLRHKGQKSRRAMRTVVHILLMLAAIFALWMPRLMYMKQETRYHVLDVRMLYRIPGLTPEAKPTWRAQPNEVILPQSELTRLGMAEYGESMKRDFWHQVDEAQETLLWVVGIPTWVFLLAALMFCRRGAKPRTRNLLLGAVILTQLAVVATVKLDRRYVVVVSAMLQVWGGLGAIEFVEWLRRKYGCLLGRFMLLRIPAMIAIAGGLACLSVFGTNQGTRHAELRLLADDVLAARGEGLRIVADTPEVPYYARGYMVQIKAMKVDDFEVDQSSLRRLVSDSGAELIVVRKGVAWCRWIYELAVADKLPQGALVSKREREGKFVYAVDSRKLFSGLEAE